MSQIIWVEIRFVDKPLVEFLQVQGEMTVSYQLSHWVCLDLWTQMITDLFAIDGIYQIQIFPLIKLAHEKPMKYAHDSICYFVWLC